MHGYQMPWYETCLRLFVRLLCFVTRLNGNNCVSNILIQHIDPVAHLPYNVNGEKRELLFRTGHGRLFWRVKSFYDEEPLMISWLSTLSDDDVFLDVGGNIGIYSIPAALRCSIVIVCELDPINVGILHENIHLNKLDDKVIIIPFGVGESNSLGMVHYREISKGDALQSINRPQQIPTLQPKPFVRPQLIFQLDWLFTVFDCPKPTKIKIDVDGNEAALWAGGKETICDAEEIYFECGSDEECLKIKASIIEAGFDIIDIQVLEKLGGENILFRKTLERDTVRN